MKDLLETIKDPNTKCKSYALVGPKGTGKSTALYWLYRQLQNCFFKVVPVLAIELTENKSYLDEIADLCEHSQYILVELAHIYIAKIGQLSYFLASYIGEKTIVLATSSSYRGMN